MGCPKMDSGINAIEEEPEELDSTSNTGALACMINYEVGAVLAIMRRNVRWGGHFMADDDQPEYSIIYSLKLLQKQIFSWPQQWSTVNPVLYLQPFLDVVRSDETGAPITGVILSLVYEILTLNVIDLNTVNVEETMHLVVDVMTSCRLEVTDPASEVVLMKILQVLLACMKSKVAIVLSNQHVCTIVDTCFRVVHQVGTKDIVEGEVPLANGVASSSKPEVRDYSFGSTQLDNGNSFVEYNGQRPSVGIASTTSMGNMMNGTIGVSPNDLQLMTKPCGVPCMVEIFHFLCSLLNIVKHIGIGPRSNTLTFDEDVPLFTLSLINSAIELGGPSICQHPKLLALIQDELFRNLMQFGLSMSSLLLSMACTKQAWGFLPAVGGCHGGSCRFLQTEDVYGGNGMAERIGNGRKYIKRRLMIDADHFNRDPKKGLEFLQGTHLLPDKLDPQSVACFFRYTAGLDKNLVGDFLGNHDDFCVQKIQRALEAFSERYYEQSQHILAKKDAAFLLSYSIILRPELLMNTLFVMKARGVLIQRSALGGDSLWELTWLHVNNINPSLQCEVFSDLDSENAQQKQNKIEGRRHSGVIESVE
ncbi:hypothetical protein GIB67_017409 [Kingdonia uniflora]|uniref:SEC7 domain-containing protein n=1 Tax=Kingdonia uniflora TaxID=39325 RepID=A0A7J7M496_9MAGN|nr:hypothetical protein GIB67_017409 [Kingdonia uniflora]